MILVTRRSSQGKGEFVRQHPGGQDTEPAARTEGVEVSWEESMDDRFYRDFQLFIRRVMEGSVIPRGHGPEGPVTEQLPKELFAGPEDRVLVADETGCSIVSIDAFERLHRKETGRLCCQAAGETEEMWRACCGIGMRIK